MVSLKSVKSPWIFCAKTGYQPCIILILEWGSLNCRLQTGYGLLFLGLENNGTIVTFLICMVKTIVFSLHFTLTVPQYLNDDHHTMYSYSLWPPLILISWLINFCTPFIALFLSYNCGGRMAIQLEHWTFFDP